MSTKRRAVCVVLLQVVILCMGLGPACAAMEIPDKLKEIPLYSGSKTLQVMDMGNNSMAMFSVKADREAIVEFYKQNMKAKGWTVAFQTEQEDAAVIHFMKDGRTIQIAVHKGDEPGTVQYHLLSVSQ